MQIAGCLASRLPLCEIGYLLNVHIRRHICRNPDNSLADGNLARSRGSALFHCDCEGGLLDTIYEPIRV